MQQKLERKAPRLAHFLKEIEIQFKWLFIWLFLKALSGPARRHTRALDPKSIKSILILRQDKIGDMVVTLPVIRTIKMFRPDIAIGVLASTVNHSVVDNDPTVSRVHIYRKSLPAVIRTFREVRTVKYDLILDLMTGASVTSLVIAMLCSPRAYRIGIAKESFRKYYDHYTLEIMNHATGLHITEMYRATLLPLGIPLEHLAENHKIALSEKQMARGREIAGKVIEPKYRGAILLNASAGKLDRTIGSDKFIRLVGEISPRYPDIQFLISYAPKELGLAEKACSAGGANVRLLPPGISIMDVVALMQHLTAVVSVDTSICHIAANLDVPLLALYTGNYENLVRWYPYNKRVWIVRSPDWKSVDGITYPQLTEAFHNFISDLSKQSIFQAVE